MKETSLRLTTAQALLRFLANQYLAIDDQINPFVHGIFGIFGHGNVTGLGEALEYASAGLPFYQGHNEQGMAHAAIAYAKQKNRLAIMACTSSIGPGASNMITAAATATTNRLPLLLLPGDIFCSRQPDPVLQQLESGYDGSLSVNDCFKPVSKYWDRIQRPEQLIPACLNALRVLTDPAETGAVTLCLPQDVQAEAYDFPESFFKKRIWTIDRQMPNPAALQRAAHCLMAAQKPLIIAGGGVHYALAADSLNEFALRHQIPVAETQAGKSALPGSHPLNVGGIGVTGSLAANRLAAQADCILVIGSRLQDFTTASKTAFKNPHCQFIHLNINPLDAHKLEALPLKADAKLGLSQLSLALSDYQTSLAYQAQIQSERANWINEVQAVTQLETTPQGKMKQTAVLGLINQMIKPDDVIISAAGSLPGDLHRLWQSQHAKDYHLEYAYSCMGYEVAAGLGVRMAKSEGEVYVLVGDGSYLMMHSELLTAVQEGLKITILLFNNHGYQCIRNLQEAHGSQGFGNEFRYRNPQSHRLDGDYLPIDFCQYAQALGAKTYYAKDYETLSAALTESRSDSQSVLIEIPVAAKTMSQGYETFWQVGLAEVSEAKTVQEAYSRQLEQLSGIL